MTSKIWENHTTHYDKLLAHSLTRKLYHTHSTFNGFNCGTLLFLPEPWTFLWWFCKRKFLVNEEQHDAHLNGLSPKNYICQICNIRLWKNYLCGLKCDVLNRSTNRRSWCNNYIGTFSRWFSVQFP